MMWKKWMGAFLTLALCVFLGTASSAEAAAKKAKEKPARVELVMVLDKSGSMRRSMSRRYSSATCLIPFTTGKTSGASSR